MHLQNSQTRLKWLCKTDTSQIKFYVLEIQLSFRWASRPVTWEGSCSTGHEIQGRGGQADMGCQQMESAGALHTVLEDRTVL
jgi:hypothetical protein